MVNYVIISIHPFSYFRIIITGFAMIDFLNHFGSLISDQALKFYIAFAALVGWIGNKVRVFLAAKKKERDAVLLRIDELEESQQTILHRMDALDKTMSEDREERKDMHRKLDLIVETTSKLATQTAVNAARLEERSKQ